MIMARPQPKPKEPMCSCGRWPMRFCVTQYSYCGKQSVSYSNYWRNKFSAMQPKTTSGDQT